MAQIFKYPLSEGGRNRVVLPRGFVPLHAAEQRGELYVWCLVDATQSDAIGLFYVVGTGWEFDYIGKSYINTVHVGPMVWHIWWEDSLGDKNESNNQQV